MSIEASDTADELDQFLWAYTSHVRQDAVGFPALVAGASVDREDARVRGGDDDRTVVHKGLGFLAALFPAPE
jgi:hypothetical protein